MPLTGWAGGLAEGINSGLRNYATIRGIQRGQEEEERAGRAEIRQGEMDKLRVEEAGQKRTLHEIAMKNYHEENDPKYRVGDVLKSVGMDDTGTKLISPHLARIGITSPDQIVSRKNIKEASELLYKDPVVKEIIDTSRYQTYTQQLADLDKKLEISKTPEGGVTPEYEKLQQQKSEISATLRMNPVYKAAQEEKIKANKEKREEEELGIRKTAAEREAATAIGTTKFHEATLKNQAVQLEIARKTLDDQTGAKLRDDQFKLIVGVSPKATQKTTDPATGEEVTIVTPDLTKGMGIARKLRPDLFKDVPAPVKDPIDWNMVWPRAEQDILGKPGDTPLMIKAKAAAFAQRLKEEPDLNMSAEVLNGPLFEDKPNLKKALKPFFPVAKKEVEEVSATPTTKTTAERTQGKPEAFAESRSLQEKTNIENKRKRDEELKRINLANETRKKAIRYPWQTQNKPSGLGGH